MEGRWERTREGRARESAGGNVRNLKALVCLVKRTPQPAGRASAHIGLARSRRPRRGALALRGARCGSRPKSAGGNVRNLKVLLRFAKLTPQPAGRASA